MIDWNSLSVAYVASQIITIIYYGLFAWSYFLKTQKSIIVVGFIAVVLNAIAYILLGAWTGLAMCFVALVRNIIRYRAETKGSSFGTSKLFFGLVIVAIICVTLPFYEGFLSLMSVFATTIYSYSVWQKSPRVYKLCGIPVGILWIIYNVFVNSIFGWILEAALLIFVIVGIVIDVRHGKLNKGHAG